MSSSVNMYLKNLDFNLWVYLPLQYLPPHSNWNQSEACSKRTDSILNVALHFCTQIIITEYLFSYIKWKAFLHMTPRIQISDKRNTLTGAGWQRRRCQAVSIKISENDHKNHENLSLSTKLRKTFETLTCPMSFFYSPTWFYLGRGRGEA